jgi:hypothetical protein
MKAKLLTLTGLCAFAVALAVPASSAAVSVQPFHSTDSNPSFEICGLDVKADFSTTGVLVFKSSGVSIGTGEFTAVWTNPATGKSIMIHGGSMFMNSAPIDNGNGTISFVGSSGGTYIVKDAHGAPFSVSAGRFVARATFDATTGELISVELLSVDGSPAPVNPPADSTCDSIVAALS